MFKNSGKKIMRVVTILFFLYLIIVVIGITACTILAGETGGTEAALTTFFVGILAGAVILVVIYIGFLPICLLAEMSQDVKQIKKALAGEISPLPKDPPDSNHKPSAPKNPSSSSRRTSVCSFCGAELPRGVMFCTQCGRPISATDGGTLSNNENPRVTPNRVMEHESARDAGHGKPGFQPPNDFEL